MAGVNTCVRDLIQNSSFDPMEIIAAVLNNAGHDVHLSTKMTDVPKTEKQKKRAKRAGKKTARLEMEEKAETEHPEWDMGGDYKYISDKVLREALENGVKPIRKPLTGYMVFLSQVRPGLKDQGLNGKEIAKEAGRQWREELDTNAKDDYKQQAIADLENKYGPQSTRKGEEKPKKTRQPRKKAASKKPAGGGGAKKTRKPRKKAPTPEPTPEPEDTPVVSNGMFDSDEDSDSDSDEE